MGLTFLNEGDRRCAYSFNEQRRDLAHGEEQGPGVRQPQLEGDLAPPLPHCGTLGWSHNLSDLHFFNCPMRTL